MFITLGDKAAKYFNTKLNNSMIKQIVKHPNSEDGVIYSVKDVLRKIVRRELKNRNLGK